MILDKWASFAQNKANEVFATFTSGAMVADGVDDSWTLAEWSTILGMIYVSSMLIPRLIEFGKWLKIKWRKRNDGNAPK